jgi:hypothetical protein
MIKSQNDVKQLIKNLKENGDTLQYETESAIVTIKYDNSINQFSMNAESKIFNNIKTKDARCVEKVMIYQLWIDRKYINKVS